jgi:hypothetical protein
MLGAEDLPQPFDLGLDLAGPARTFECAAQLNAGERSRQLDALRETGVMPDRICTDKMSGARGDRPTCPALTAGFQCPLPNINPESAPVEIYTTSGTRPQSSRGGLGAQEPIEERPIVVQRPTQILGGHVAFPSPLTFQLLLMPAEGGRHRLHHLSDQSIRLLHRGPGIVHESGLDLLPTGPETVGVLLVEQQGSRVCHSGGRGRRRLS